MKYQILFGVGMSAMLAACSPSSSNSGSSSGGAAAVQSVPAGPVLAKADLAVVANASSNALLSDIAGSLSVSQATSQFSLIKSYLNGVGDFSTLDADSGKDCVDEKLSLSFPFSSSSATFHCDHVTGTFSSGPMASTDDSASVTIETSIQLSLSGSGDTAVISHDKQVGPYQFPIIPQIISGTRTMDDTYVIGGVTYILKENSKYSRDQKSGVITLSGQLDVKKDDTVSESLVITGSADLRSEECGFDAGSVSYKGPNSDLEISFQGCNAMTVTANGEIVVQTVPAPVVVIPPPVVVPPINFPIPSIDPTKVPATNSANITID